MRARPLNRSFSGLNNLIRLQNPLSIPAILITVASFLHVDDIWTCAFVSRHFRATLWPILWKEPIVLSQKLGYTLESLNRNAALVQSLLIHVSFGAYAKEAASFYYQNLKKLTISGCCWELPLDAWIFRLDDRPRQLIQRHCISLRELVLKNLRRRQFNAEPIEDKEDLPEFWSTIAELSLLKSLTAEGIDICSPESLRVFWDLSFSRLTQLVLENTSIIQGKAIMDTGTAIQTKLRVTSPSTPSSSSSSSSPPWSSWSPSSTLLQQITVVAVKFNKESLNRIFQLLVKSPSLQSLDWGCLTLVRRDGREDPNISLESVVEMAKSQRRKLWPELTRLKIIGPDTTGDRLGRALLRLGFYRGGLQDLELFETSANQQTCHAIMIAHCGSLTQLDIALSTNISSAMIHMILCSCSTLVAMKADNILASDLVKFDKPWACTNLQKWEIAIEMDINGVGTHRQVFARLSTLTKVLTLNLSSDKDLRLSRGTNHPFLALRLSHGMDRLASMEHLRVLQIDYTNQRMAKVDWEWVVATFQRLRSIQGRSVGAYDDYKDYSAAMSYAGVEYSFWAEPRSRLRQPKSA